MAGSADTGHATARQLTLNGSEPNVAHCVPGDGLHNACVPIATFRSGQTAPFLQHAAALDLNALISHFEEFQRRLPAMIYDIVHKEATKFRCELRSALDASCGELRRELLGELAAYVTSSNARSVALEDNLQEDMQRFSQFLHSLEKQVQLTAQSVKTIHGSKRGSADGNARFVSQTEYAPAVLQVPESVVQMSIDAVDKVIMDAAVHVPATDIDQSSIEPSPRPHLLHDVAVTAAAPAHATRSPWPLCQLPKEELSCAPLTLTPRPHHLNAAGKEELWSAPPMHKRDLFPPSEQRSVIHGRVDSLEDTIRIDEPTQCANKRRQPAHSPQPVASLGRYMVSAGTITIEKIDSAFAAEGVSEKINSKSLDASSSSSHARKANKRVRFAYEHRGKGGGIVDGIATHTPSDLNRAWEPERPAVTPEEDSKRACFASEHQGKSGGGVEIPANATSDSSNAREVETLAATPEEVASAVKQAIGVCYSLAQLTDSKVWRTLPNVVPAEREQLLSPPDFEEVFEMRKDDFEKLPRWKRDWMKQSRALF